MNLAHAHLILNHIPVLTLPMSLLFLVYALWRQNEDLKKFTLIMLILTAATVLPAYFTGEPAEKIIEHMPGVSEKLIDAHEEAAEFSLVATLVTGAIAIAVFFLQSAKFKRANKIVIRLIILSCLVSIVSLGYTANLGGKIRHPETTNSFLKNSTSNSNE